MIPLWDNQSLRRPAVITGLLVAINMVVFVYELVLAARGGVALETFVSGHALVPSRLLAGMGDGVQWLTLGSHMFLHGSVAHVVGNCWFLWVFGRSVEQKLGAWRFLLLYALSGVAAAAAQVGVDVSSEVPMIGASGAISGVLGAYFILMPTAWIVALVPWIVPIVPVPAFVFLLLWFALQAMNGFGVLFNGTAGGGGVAWWAHAGGFVAGLWLTWWAKRRRWLRTR